jgi:hypothetical protein
MRRNPRICGVCVSDAEEMVEDLSQALDLQTYLYSSADGRPALVISPGSERALSK